MRLVLEDGVIPVSGACLRATDPRAATYAATAVAGGAETRVLSSPDSHGRYRNSTFALSASERVSVR